MGTPGATPSSPQGSVTSSPSEGARFEAFNDAQCWPGNAPVTFGALRTQGEAEVLEEPDVGCKSQARALFI
eukprot:4784535-Prorocentrum_lima.AAC.1